MKTSPQKRREIIDALRRGTVPQQGLDALAVGLSTFEFTIDEELDLVGKRGSVFKAIRGEYGSGKTFFVRWLQERARKRGFLSSEIQVSETETPLHKLETVYRRMMERLCMGSADGGSFRDLIDSWFYTLEEEVLADSSVDANDEKLLLERTTEVMEKRLAGVSKQTPIFASVLRAYRVAVFEDDLATAQGLLAWLSGQPNVAASVKRKAGVKGELDHFGALSFLQGILTIIKDAGLPGVVLVMDEVETLQRVRSDVREKGLNALRQWIDEIDSGRFPGLYLLITGTPAFFDGPQGVKRLAPLAQRVHVDFQTDARFDNPRAVQLRLKGFDLDSLCELGQKVRDLFHEDRGNPRIRSLVDDAYIVALAKAVTGRLGNKVGIVPRIFLKKLVAGVLDCVDLHPEFDPRENYTLTVDSSELSEVERNAMAAGNVDEIELDL